MISAMLGIVLVFSPVPQCDGFMACSYGNTVYVQGEQQALTFSFDPASVTFPHFSSTSHRNWMECGYEIARQAGVRVEYNRAEHLCREVKHVVYGRSHLQ